LKEEFAIVLEGKLVLTLGQTEHVVEQGDAVTILAGMARRWHNPYDAPARVLVTASR
jgi:quercetin dioxygenase-like cupin family protein